MQISWSDVVETALGFIAANLLFAVALALLGFTSTEEVASTLKEYTQPQRDEELFV